MFRRARSSDMVSHHNRASAQYAQNVNTFDAQTLLILGSNLDLKDKKTAVLGCCHFRPIRPKIQWHICHFFHHGHVTSEQLRVSVLSVTFCQVNSKNTSVKC